MAYAIENPTKKRKQQGPPRPVVLIEMSPKAMQQAHDAPRERVERSDWVARTAIESLLGKDKAAQCIADLCRGRGDAGLERWTQYMSYQTAFGRERSRNLLRAAQTSLRAAQRV